jgi:RNA polymerase sigma-70 factor (ECF subfamily)
MAAPKLRVRMLSPEQPAARADGLDSRSDDELVGACLDGRRDAFDLIVARHQKSIYQICYRFAGNHADASDLSQETFLRAWRSLRGFKRQSSLGTWLYRIAVNASLNRVSTRRPAAENVDDLRLPDERSATPADGVLRDEQATAVRRAIASLPDRQRATVILRVYHELPHHEIAAILGSSVGSVKANFFHALRSLRRLIGEQS